MLWNRLIYVARMAWGGAVIGFLIGIVLSLFGAIVAMTLNSRATIEMEHVLLSGAILSALASGWSSYLAIREPYDPLDNSIGSEQRLR